MNANADTENNELDSISFRYPKQLIVVDAFVENESNHKSFIFDTGAFYTKIEKSLAESLGLKTVFTKNNSTAAGVSRQVEMTAIPSIRFSETNFKNMVAGKLKYDKSSYSPCVAKDGIIGANLIKLQNWKIDYQAQKMYFASEPFRLEDINSKQTIAFDRSFLSGIPEIEIQIEDKVISNVLFDLGYNGGLVLPKSLAKKFTSQNEQTILDQSTSGIFGSNLDTLLVKDLTVTIAGTTEIIPVEFSSLNKALLGNDFLEHFLVYINYKEDKITLIQKEEVVVDQPSHFIPGILNDSLWIVNRTTPNSQFKIGDTLQCINGKKPRDLFKNHCDYFYNLSEMIALDSLQIVR